MSDRCFSPEIILLNGKIHTQDDRNPLAEAVAVSGNRIAAVGDNKSIRSLARKSTRVIDAAGCSVIPGMMDPHIHFYEWAIKRKMPDLSGAGSLDEMLGRVSEFSRNLAPGRWLLAHGWNEADWPERRMPTRRELDRAVPDNPAILWRCDYHLASVNGKALESAGIDRDTPDPPEGQIERNPDGTPNGILRELAINLIRDVLPTPDDDHIVSSMEEGMRHLHGLGITAIADVRLMNDADGPRAFRCFQKMRERNILDLRCWVSIAGDRLDEAIDLGLRTGFGDDRLRLGHVKYFADGGMGARTAWMIEPYLDAGIGMPLTDPKELLEAVEKADRAGLAVMIHAIGQRAIREVISIFEKVQEQRKRRGRTGDAGAVLAHRMEHVQMIHPEELPRLARLKIPLCLTPMNMILDINMVDECMGKRARWAYAIRDLIDTGSPVMFSSDCPVCDPNPFTGIRAAVTRTRKDLTPEGGWYPESRVSLTQALACYTRIPAAVHGVGDRLGMIRPGYLADIAVLDRDLFETRPENLDDVGVSTTMFDGRLVR